MSKIQRIAKLYVIENEGNCMRRDILDGLKLEYELHPHMEGMDVVKLLHQAAYGPQHMIDDERKSLKRIIEERKQCVHRRDEKPQRISKQYYRVPLSYMKEEDLPLWNALFISSAKTAKKDEQLFHECMAELKEEHLLNSYENTLLHEGTHHSYMYRKHHYPHYRLIRSEYVDDIGCIRFIMEKAKLHDHCIIAIDGRSCSGKSTLAKALQDFFEGNLFHMDDYFLPEHKKSEKRLAKVGGNIDYTRFKKEVIDPLRRKEVVVYQPFDCKTQSLKDPITVEPKKITIVEGVYAMHPYFKRYYHVRLFLLCDKDVQRKRLYYRSPQLIERFYKEWIPMEECYFKAIKIIDRSDVVINTSFKEYDDM